jgi:hypothetical protein
MVPMRRCWLVVAWSLAVPALLGAQENARDRATDSDYRGLVREYETARQAYTKANSTATNDADRRQLQKQRPDTAAFARRFLDLASAKPADKSSFDAISWVLTHTPHGAEGDRALELLAASHLDDPRLGPILQHLGSSKSPAAEKLLRAALEKSQDREIQAHACYTLAIMLAAREHHAAPVRHRPTRTKKAQVAKPETADSQNEEIEVLYGRLLKDFREIKPSKKSRKTYGEIAIEALEKIKIRKERSGTVGSSFPRGVGLEVGMVAPPIQGLDTSGSPMRLADFRGKVVVLDFWGDW